MNDERIARLADALIGAEQRTGVSEGPVRINDRFFAFVRTPLFDGRLHVYLPDDFTDMPEEESRIKYPSSNRPNTIKADERGAICFTFDIIDSPLDEKSVPRLASEMRAMLQKLNPSFLFFEPEESRGSEEAEGSTRPRAIAYKSPAIDGAVYNMMFFAPMGGKTMMGTFSCPHGEHEEWKEVVSEVLALIETDREEENV
jgi:hypothetical protein